MSKVYLYVVYELYFRYKEYNKFHEIALTSNQLEIKEKYLGRDDIKIDFFGVATEYANKVLKYVQDKYVKASFPFNVKSGELQSVCSEFINKCNSLVTEKQQQCTVVYQQPQPQEYKAIALVIHKTTNNITVVYNNNNIT